MSRPSAAASGSGGTITGSISSNGTCWIIARNQKDETPFTYTVYPDGTVEVGQLNVDEATQSQSPSSKPINKILSRRGFAGPNDRKIIARTKLNNDAVLSNPETHTEGPHTSVQQTTKEYEGFGDPGLFIAPRIALDWNDRQVEVWTVWPWNSRDTSVNSVSLGFAQTRDQVKILRDRI